MQSQQPAKQYYNNPINLYSQENVVEIAKMNKMGMSGMSGMSGLSGPSTSPTGLIHPNKPQQIGFAPTKDYNPKESATWLALQESDPSIDPEKLKNYSTLREHDPIYAEVYEAPKHPLDNKSMSPRPAPIKIYQNPSNKVVNNSCNDNIHLQPERSTIQSPIKSPVAELLPPSFRKGQEIPQQKNRERTTSDSQPSAVWNAALADSKSVYVNASNDVEGLPLYETNSIGGRRRIAQSAAFNRLMMDVLGE